MVGLHVALFAHADAGRSAFMPQLHARRGPVAEHAHAVLKQGVDVLPIPPELHPRLQLLLLLLLLLGGGLHVGGCGGWVVVVCVGAGSRSE